MHAKTTSFFPEPTPRARSGECNLDASVPEFVEIDPLLDARWDSLVSVLDRSSVFQTSHWARVLHDTYGHRPFYFCQSSNGRPEVLLPLMEVSSRWTGRRGVSLPFTDFCPLFSANSEARQSLHRVLVRRGRERGWRYFECRSNESQSVSNQPSLRFYGHIIELDKKQDVLIARMGGATRRGIRKAQEANLQIEFSTTLVSMRSFYALHCQTRRRHGVPPQPFRFFENIVRHIFETGHGFVALARLAGRPIGAAVFFYHRREALYKFGASDESFQHLRVNNLLMWEAMKRCAELGCEVLHLGRTSLGQEGLRRFKLGFGGREEQINYYKYDFGKQAFITQADRARSGITNLFKCFPLPLFRLAGRFLYPHLS